MIRHRFWFCTSCPEVYLEKWLDLPAFIPDGYRIELGRTSGAALHVSEPEFSIDSGEVWAMVSGLDDHPEDWNVRLILELLVRGWQITDSGEMDDGTAVADLIDTNTIAAYSKFSEFHPYHRDQGLRESGFDKCRIFKYCGLERDVRSM